MSVELYDSWLMKITFNNTSINGVHKTHQKLLCFILKDCILAYVHKLCCVIGPLV